MDLRKNLRRVHEDVASLGDEAKVARPGSYKFAINVKARH